MDKNKLILPAAIVIAGVIIAGGIYVTDKNNPSPTPQQQDTEQVEPIIINTPPLTGQDHVIGNINAPVLMLEFSDTECPFCKQFHETMKRLVSDKDIGEKVAWIYKHFPIDQLHSKARKESESAECAAELGGNEKFWQYINKVYEITPSNNGLDPANLPKIAGDIGLNVTAFNQCLTSGRTAEKVQSNYEQAVKAGARGTPTTILILKDPAKQSTLNFIDNAITELGIPGEILKISEDKTKIFVGGALPYEFMKELITVITS